MINYDMIWYDMIWYQKSQYDKMQNNIVCWNMQNKLYKILQLFKLCQIIIYFYCMFLKNIW